MLNQITPLILTWNEEANISRTLDALRWAGRIIVVDSFSDDETATICSKYPNVDFIQRIFEQHAMQWNFGLQQNIQTEWILALDADHIISDELIAELQALTPDQDINGYWASFRYVISGAVLGQSLYPPLVSLFRNNRGHYVQDGHTQRIQVEGTLGTLQGKIFHDDRKNFKRWLNSQWKYAQQEASKIRKRGWSELPLADLLRKIGIAPIVVLPYTLFAKGLIFSGWPGLIYSTQRVIAELALQFARVRAVFTPGAQK